MLSNALGLTDPKLRVLLCRWRCVDTWTKRPLNSGFWRLYWNLTPGAAVIWKGRRYELSPDRWMLIAPGTEATPEQTAPFEHFFVHFRLRPELRLKWSGVYSGRVAASLRSTLQTLVDQASQGATPTAWQSLSVYSLVLEVLTTLPSEQWRALPHDARVRETVRLIEEHLAAPLSAEELGKRVGMHASSLRRLFRSQIGMAPGQYAIQLRLDDACELIAQTDDSIDQIADSLGFYDRYHLTRLMARHLNITPGRLRKLGAADRSFRT